MESNSTTDDKLTRNNQLKFINGKCHLDATKTVERILRFHSIII